MAGCMADGCRTVAPKKASSVASSKVSIGTGRASFTILGSEVSTPAGDPGLLKSDTFPFLSRTRASDYGPPRCLQKPLSSDARFTQRSVWVPSKAALSPPMLINGHVSSSSWVNVYEVA